MKAVRVHSAGGPESLCYEEVPEPKLRPGKALIRIEAAGLNYIDIYHRNGLYGGSFPLILGQEGAGTVVAIGPEVSEVRVGDRVAYIWLSGAYAQYATVPAGRLVKLPPGISTREGAAMMLQGMTAHFLACTTYPLEVGDSCLVHAAAGGVGLLLCQIAKMRGATVIATVSSDEKAELARAAGADHVIDYTRNDFQAEVRRLTDQEGVDVIYDSVGKTTFEKGFDCLASRGMMVLYGQSSGPVSPIDPRILYEKGSVYLTRPNLVDYTARPEDLQQRAGEVLDWIRQAKLRLRICRELPLAEAAQAHRLLEGRQTTGKVLLIPEKG